MSTDQWNRSAVVSGASPRAALRLLALALLIFAIVALNSQLLAAPDPTRTHLNGEFTQSIHPLLQQYCFGCHSTDKHKGDIDLEQFTALERVLRQSKTWEKVVEELSLGEMPPKGKPRPDASEQSRLLEWINHALDISALARAGDPGPVPLRRLDNAEYTYTIQDLTGVALLNPAKEFPGDSAAGEGFMNTGGSLVMSPALLQKYFDAGKEIASHAVLLPDGFRFSAKMTRRDWTEEILAEIRDIYRRYSDSSGADKVNLQGIVFETNEGGRLPLAAYLRATLDWRIQLERGETNGTLESLAATRGLSPKYLASLWQVLHESSASPILDLIRARWRAGQPDDAAALAASIGVWQKALWKFSHVGHIGKLGGPKAWMEPLSPLVEKQEFRWKLDVPTNRHDSITVFLAATDAGDGDSGDFVLWKEPRLVRPGHSDLPLREARDYFRDALKAPDGHSAAEMDWGLAPELFGKRPDGSVFETNSLCVHAPAVLEVRFPADLVRGAELVTTGTLDPTLGREGSVQLQVTQSRPEAARGLVADELNMRTGTGPWTSNNFQVSHERPIVVLENSAARRRLETSCDEFRRWFPAALCYEKIVPTDEVITLILFHREDEPLCRLMLTEDERRRLDRLWDELRYVSRDALTLVDAFDQLWQYATQDADPKVFEPLRQPIRDRAAAFRQRLVSTEPRQVDALVEFAAKAYRRPLADAEADQLRGLYRELRTQGLAHEQAFQLTLARIFVAPAFLYRLEKAQPGKESHPVSDWELASRLSYFLWSSAPDAELRRCAASGELRDPDHLVAQARRMLVDRKVRRLAVEFGCAWLHLYDFPELNEKSERHFPLFTKLREPMFEEAVHYLTDIFQRDGSVLELFDSDHTFLNESLAKQYGIPNVSGPEWRRVDGVRAFGRGGVLGLGAVLAKESGASRTSPILRGDWVAEVLLGDKVPRPPKDVPRLPEDETTDALTVRQLVEKHRQDPRCASCHLRIDGYGFALEGYDAIGLPRTHDLAGRSLDTRATLFDGTSVKGADDLRHYLVTAKRDVVMHQFCRKILGYALGRGVILSDKPLIDSMVAQLKDSDFRFSAAVETILRSRQFRELRGQDTTDDDDSANAVQIRASL